MGAILKVAHDQKVLLFLSGTFIPNLSESCYRCLCYVSTKCEIEHECTAGYCGPFNISRVYWVDAGKVVMPEDDADRNHGKVNFMTMEIRVMLLLLSALTNEHQMGIKTELCNIYYLLLL